MFSSPAIVDMLKDLHTLSGLRISIYDTEFNRLVSYPENASSFCALMQTNSRALARCVAADKEALERVRDTGDIYLYKCRFGLWEVACPLYRKGILVGYLMMGQGKDSSCSAEETVLEKALHYHEDETAIKKSLEALPTLSQEVVSAFSHIMTLCAEHVVYLSGTPVSSDSLADSVMVYIDRNMEKKLSIDYLCSVFHCSKSTLTTLFRQRHGVTIGEYITERRIESAKRLLSKENDAIGVVALRCGFADQGYFSKVFLQRVGCSPSEYRQKTKTK